MNLSFGKLTEALCEGACDDPVAQREEEGVVAADGAGDLGQLGLVEREADEMGGAGRGLEDEEVAGGLDREHPLAEDPLKARGGPVAVAELIGKGVGKGAAALH